MNYLRHILLLGILLLGFLAQAQPKADEKTRELVSLGKKQYFNSQWKDAANSFELATQRPVNDLSSFAWYMSAMSYFNMGSLEQAEVSFAKFSKEYPDSKYLEEVQYHRALILLQSTHTNDRDKGLDQMFTLLSRSSSKDLKASADNSIRHFLFNVYEPSYLNIYRVFAKDEYKVVFTEALCANFDKKGEGQKALEEIKKWEASGGASSPYLNALKAKLQSGRQVSSSRLNIAVCLTFHGESADTARYLPSKSKSAIEMLEGMMMALDSLGPGLRKEINVKAFDTRGDSNYTKTALIDSLSRFNPDIIIGDVRTGVAMVISAWAERNKVLHIIPRNPLNDLISGKKYTFLAHPSLASHGAGLANYMVKEQGKRTVTIYNDRTFYSEKLSQAFAEAAKANGATVTEKIISKEPAKVKGEASLAAQAIKSNGTDLVYVPISNEESAGMIISYLNFHSAKPTVVGGPDWETFNIIDSQLKTSFQLKYSTMFFDKNDSLACQNLKFTCSDTYFYEPSSSTIIGYDIMAWVLQIGKTISAYPDPAMAVHKAESYHGIHQDIYFGDKQDNQKVNIVQFTKGRIDKVNHD